MTWWTDVWLVGFIESHVMVVLQYNTSPADGETNDRCPKNTWGFVIINLESYLPCDTTGAFVLREWGQRLLGQNRMVWESIT